MRARRQRLRTLLFLVVGLASAGLGLAAYFADALRNPELDTVDVRFSIRGKEAPPDDLVVVQIDDVTFQDLALRWPFPRTEHARVLERLRKDGAKAVAYDVQFSEPSEEEREDIALFDAIERARKVVLATTEVNEFGEPNVIGGKELLRDVGSRAGNALLPPDPGGVNRRVPYRVDGLESFAVAAAETVTGRQVERSSLGGDTAWIDYHGPPGTIESVSFSRVRNARTRPGFFRGKVVVVGPSAPSLQDVHPTSTSGDELMAGAEIQANAISTVLRGFPLQESSTALDVVLIALLGLAAPLASLRLRPLLALALAAALGLAYAGVTQLAFGAGTILSFVYPVGTLGLSAVGALAVHYVTTAFERERVRDMFSRFVPETVVDQVLARTEDDLRLGGVRLVSTVMFSDLRGFTSFAESLPPDRVIEVLNRYLGEMSEAILDHGGTLVAYMGDGIMAVFGAPIEQEDHGDRALAAAREMLRRLEGFNEWLRSEGLGEGFKMGIGLNSGPVMSGNVGSERRLEYTSIGDTTNTAARLEGMTKGTPHQLYVADSTRVLLASEPGDLVYVDELDVRGRQAKVKLWSLAEPERGPPEPERAAAPAEGA